MSLEDRIVRLENQHRFWKVVALGQFVVVCVILSCMLPEYPDLIIPQASALGSGGLNEAVQKEIKTHRLTIVDNGGRTVGSFTAGDDGDANLMVGNELGKHKVELSAMPTESYSSVRAGGSDGEVVMSFKGVTVYPFDKRYAEFMDTIKTKPGSTTSDRIDKALEARRRAIRIGLNDFGSGTIEVINPLNEPVVVMQSSKSNEGAVFVMDVNGKIKNALLPLK